MREMTTLADEPALSPTYMSNSTHPVLAEDTCPERLPGDEPEPLEAVPWPLTALPSPP